MITGSIKAFPNISLKVIVGETTVYERKYVIWHACNKLQVLLSDNTAKLSLCLVGPYFFSICRLQDYVLFYTEHSL